MTVEKKNLDEQYEKVGEIVSIFKRGDVYQGNWQDDNRQRRQSLRTTNKQAAIKKARCKLEARILAGEDPSRQRTLTVSDGVEVYMEYQKTEDRAYKTLRLYRRTLDMLNQLCASMGVHYLSQLNLRVMDAFKAMRVKAERHPKTICNELTVVKQLVNFALSRNLIEVDPLKGFKVKRPDPTPQPCFSWEQMAAIVAAVKEPAKSCLAFLAATGARAGEAVHLTWDDVDFARGVVHLRSKTWEEKSKDGKILKRTWRTKNRRDRSVPMNDTIRTILSGVPRHGHWVFTMPVVAGNAKRDRRMDARWLYRRLKAALEPLGFEGHLHTLRHSFVSHALTVVGIPEPVIQQVVGHMDPKMIRLYTHLLDGVAMEQMQRLTDAGRPGVAKALPHATSDSAVKSDISAFSARRKGKKK